MNAVQRQEIIDTLFQSRLPKARGGQNQLGLQPSCSFASPTAGQFANLLRFLSTGWRPWHCQASKGWSSQNADWDATL